MSAGPGTVLQHILRAHANPARAWAEAKEAGESYRFWAIALSTMMATALAISGVDFAALRAEFGEGGQSIAVTGVFIGAGAAAFLLLWALQTLYFYLCAALLRFVSRLVGAPFGRREHRAAAALLLTSHLGLWAVALALETPMAGLDLSAWGAEIAPISHLIALAAMAPVSFLVLRAARPSSIGAVLAMALCPVAASAALMMVGLVALR